MSRLKQQVVSVVRMLCQKLDLTAYVLRTFLQILFGTMARAFESATQPYKKYFD